MKKSILFLILGIMALARGTCFATDYDLWVAGVRVTSNNCLHITGPDIQGLVSYNVNTNTLTLNNATLEGMIRCEVDGLKVYLLGDNAITNYNGYGVTIVNSDFTFYGSGSLSVVASQYAICNPSGHCSDKTLSFTGDCRVDARGGYGGINYQGNVVVNNLELRAKGNNGLSFCCENLVLNERSIIQPVGAYFDSNNGAVKYSDGNSVVQSEYVVIEPTLYNLWVNNIQVSALNASDILGDGTMSYDADEIELTLNGVSAHFTNRIGIYNDIYNLSIKVEGENSITADNSIALYSSQGLVIYGSGTLNLTGSQTVCLAGTSYIIDCTLNAVATGLYQTAIKTNDVNKDLHIINAKVSARNVNDDCSPIVGFTTFDLIDCAVWSPANAVWNNQQKWFEVDGVQVTDPIFIGPADFNLMVAGVQVTPQNASRVTGDGITGLVKYDYATNTLKLENATLDVNNCDIGIFSDIEGLNINLKGKNTIRGGNYGIKFDSNHLTIYGTGTLNISAGYGIYPIKETASLAVEGVSAINIVATKYAIYMKYGSVAIDDSYLRIEGRDDGALVASSLTLSHAQIVSPVDAEFIAGNRGICYAGTNLWVAGQTVVIAPDNYKLWVGGVAVTKDNASNITGSDITGQVSYDAVTNVLTLNNASISVNEHTGSAGVGNGIVGFTLKLIGTNSISNSDSFQQGICCLDGGDLVIDGRGSLSISSEGSGIMTNAGDVTIQGGGAVSITCQGDRPGIHSYSKTGSTFTLDGSSLNISASGGGIRGVISGFSDFVVRGAVISVPGPQTVWNSERHRLEYYHNLVTHIEIAPAAYEVWIGNTQVTEANAADVLGDGTVRYDALRNVLTLNNANINMTSVSGITIGELGLTLRLVGSNTVSSSNAYGIDGQSDFTIEGTSNDNLTVSGLYGIRMYDGDLTIQGGCRVDATALHIGNYAAIYSRPAYGNSLIIKRSRVNASTMLADYAIYGFASLELENCEIHNPATATYNGQYLEDNGSPVKSALIVPQDYNIWVAGTSVDMSNYADVLGDGTVSFDPEANMLTLNNASIVSENINYAGIQNNRDGLRINLQGNNTITAVNDGILLGYANTTFMGGGSLVVTATATGIYTFSDANNTLSITDGCTVEFHSTQGYGIYLTHFNVVVDGAMLKALGHNPRASVMCYSLTMTNTSITQPVGGRFWGGAVHYAQGEEPVCTQVIISPNPYDLWVAGTQVTYANRNDVLGDGTVSYDNVNHVLTLHNADITAYAANGIRNEIDGLRINLEGNNTINPVTSYGSLFTDGDLYISGHGQLDIETNGAPITVSGSRLVIEGGCTVNAASSGGAQFYAIEGYNGAFGLTVTNSTLTASANFNAISGFSSLTLNGCSITQPEGAAWNEISHCVELDWTPCSQVSIEPDKFDVNVAGTQVTTANAPDVLGDGTVSYDAEHHLLTLNNADISCDFDGIFNFSVDNLTIRLLGTNSVVSTQNAGICDAQGNLVIDGPGSLYLEGSDGILFREDLTLQGGCNLDILAWDEGYSADFYSNTGSDINIINSTVRARCANGYDGVFRGLHLLNLEGCSIVSPEYTVINDETYRLEDANGEPVRDLYIAADPVNLWVAGTRVTTANAPDVLGDGTVSYDAEQNVLTLNNATISVYNINVDGIVNEIDDLTIRLVGENAITSSQANGIRSDLHNLVIDGRGMLNICAIMVGLSCTADLTVQGGCELLVNGCVAGIRGGTIDETTFTITNSRVYSYSSGDPEGAIQGFTHFVTEGCGITQPFNGYYDENNLYVVDVNEEPARSVRITPIEYGIRVAGTQVTAANAPDVLGNGMVSYDPDENVLTLHDLYLETRDCSGIVNSVENLTIRVVGQNSIYSQNHVAISSNYDMVIEGGPYQSLYVAGPNGIAGNNITIQGGCAVEARANQNDASSYAIRCQQDLNITYSELIAHAPYSTTGAVQCNNMMNMGNEITLPEYGYHDYAYSCIVDANGNPAKEVRIEGIKYDIYVNSYRVSEVNRTDVLGDGTVSYDPMSNTLTLNNAHIEDYYGNGHSGIGIKNESEWNSLNIVLIGENSISANSGIEFGSPSGSITGPGSLTIEAEYGITNNSTSWENIAISYVPSLEIDATYGGIVLGNGLNVSNSSLTVTGSMQGSIICGFLNTFDCAITTPSDARVDWVTDLNHYALVDSNGDIITSQVVISPYTYDLWVGGVEVTSVNSNDVLGDGKVVYDPMSYTLTLNGASIDCTDSSIEEPDGIRYMAEYGTLNIVLIGENTFVVNQYGIYFDNAGVILRGPGSLLIDSATGIYSTSSGNQLTVCDGAVIDIHAFFSGIMMYDCSLVVDHSEMNVGGSMGGCIMCSDITLNGSRIVAPEGAVFDPIDHRVELDGVMVKNNVHILRDEFDLYVDGNQVTLDNAADVLHDGTVSFNAIDNTLTLNNASFQSTGYGIENHIDGLAIQLVSYNSVASFDAAAIYSDVNLTLNGSGMLNAEGTDGIAVTADLDIEGGCTVNATGTVGAGLCARAGGLVFDLADLFVDGWNDAALIATFSDGTPQQTMTIPWGSNSATYRFDVAMGTNVTLTWQAGSWDSECSFTVRYDGGSEILHQSGAFSSPIQFTFLPYGLDDATLTITNSTVNAQSPLGFANGALCGFGTFNPVGCNITAPIGGYWYENEHTVKAGGSVARNVTISPQAFDLWVSNVRVNTGNAADILGNGTVSFDPENSVLTLNNATISSPEGDGINTQLDALTIRVIGNNTVTAQNEYADGIESWSQLVIEGTAADQVSFSGRMGIFSMSSNLTIQGGLTVTATGNSNGLSGIYGYGSGTTFTTSGSTVVALCPGVVNGFIYGFDYLVLDDCVISDPEGGYWDTGVHRIIAPAHSMEVISPTPYDLWVGGTRVNIVNAADVLGDGTVSYDANRNMLSLNGAIIQNENGYGIQNGIDDLTIAVEGNDVNRINTPMSRAIYSTGDNLTVSGEGRLMAMGGIETTGDLTFMGGGEFMPRGQEHEGIKGTSTSTLVVDNCTIDVNGSNAICGFGSLRLKRTEVTQPIEGHYTSSGYKDSNDMNANMVHIQPVSMYVFSNVVDNSWSEVGNWEDGLMPTAPGHKVYIAGNCEIDDDVIVNYIDIDEQASVTVTSGNALTVENVVNSYAENLIVEDGAQLVSGNASLQATVLKYVRAWTIGAGWSLIALPTTTTALGDTDLADDTYDLYRYDETNHAGEEWQNYQEVAFALQGGRGYLYANEDPAIHRFQGTLNHANVVVPITYTTPQDDYPLAGFNLIGNPFTHDIYKGTGLAIDNANLATGYYTLNLNGSWEAQMDATPIAPCQAVMVVTSASCNLTIANTTAAPSARAASAIALSVSGNAMSDKVYLAEGQGSSLVKLGHLNADAPMLYFAEEGKAYAIKEQADLSGDHVLCFEAKAEGRYTLSLAQQGRTVVLTDTLTGLTVDLSQGSYSFMASPSDTAERFVLSVK